MKRANPYISKSLSFAKKDKFLQFPTTFYYCSVLDCFHTIGKDIHSARITTYGPEETAFPTFENTPSSRLLKVFAKEINKVVNDFLGISFGGGQIFPL